MKFDSPHRFWKHDNCTDCFISVNGVSFDDNGKDAFIWAAWMTQGTESYWSASLSERLKITPENYDKWKPYIPNGKYRF